MTDADRSDAHRRAVQDLAALKAEHGPILKQIAADPHMAPETREMLVEHIYEEEDEHVQAMLGLREQAPLAGGTAGAPPPAPADAATSAATSAPTSALTVGSLRPVEPRSTRLGSMRPSAASFGGSAGLPRGTTVGNLRPR